MQSGIDPFARQASENRRFLVTGAILLLVSIVVGLGAGVLGARGWGSRPVTQSVGGGSRPITAATGGPQVPVTQASGSSAPLTQAPKETKAMPKEVLDWLKHLQETDARRNDLSLKQLSQLMVQFTMLQGVGASEEVAKGLLQDDPDVEHKTPASEIAKQADDQKAAWRDLITFFDSVPPPPECLPIRNAYSQCLGETREMLGQVLDTIGGADQDPKGAVSALNRLRGKSSGRIDAAGRQTDDLVQQVCDKYEVRKWFSVSGDVGSGLGGILGSVPMK